MAYRKAARVYRRYGCPIVSVGKVVRFVAVTSLRDVLVVRQLRNTCYNQLTNYREYISVLQQIRWHFSYYRKEVRSGVYRLYLALNAVDSPVGYGALFLQDNQLYVTECVTPEHRGQGYGRTILFHLISIARQEHLPLVAEIWATNQNSIMLHARAGFLYESTKVKLDGELHIYRLQF